MTLEREKTESHLDFRRQNILSLKTHKSTIPCNSLHRDTQTGAVERVIEEDGCAFALIIQGELGIPKEGATCVGILGQFRFVIVGREEGFSLRISPHLTLGQALLRLIKVSVGTFIHYDDLVNMIFGRGSANKFLLF